MFTFKSIEPMIQFLMYTEVKGQVSIHAGVNLTHDNVKLLHAHGFKLESIGTCTLTPTDALFRGLTIIKE